MEFVGNIVDFGNAPEIYVAEVCRVELITPNIVRVTYSEPHRQADGTIENRIVLHALWDRAVWEGLPNIHESAKTALLGAPHEKLFLAPAMPH